MVATPAAYKPLRERFLDARRSAGDFLSGGGLVLAIALFSIWAVIDRRDAVVVGIVEGSILALGAVGLTLIYGVLKFAHFAHGDSMMLAAYVAFFLLTGVVSSSQPGTDTEILPVSISDLPGATTDIWKFSFGYGLLVAAALAALVTGGVLVVLDRLVYRHLRRRSSGIVIFSIASLGLAIAIRSVVLMLWGPTPRKYTTVVRERVELPFDITILADQLFIIGAAITVTFVVYVVLFRTKLGKAMRAMADNPDLARISGINTELVIVLTWALAGALVTVAGVLLALQAQLDPQLGFVLLLPLFAAAILGGVGNPQGAFVGGMIVGVVQAVVVTFDFLSPGYKFPVAFVILITILLLRPSGLFGTRQ
jgi:branched-chain amino acid transport system permease protein